MNSNQKALFWLVTAGSAVALYAVVRRARELDLRDRVVLIAGGSRGLGFLLAQEFARQGARVAISARHPHELHKAQEKLEGSGAEIYPIRCDVGDRNQVRRMVDDVTMSLGPVDILVNCAGIMEVGPIENMDLQNFERAMAVMFWGPLYAIQAALPSMLERGQGTIVNIASIGGKMSFPHLIPYSAAKFALLGLSEGLHAELGSKGVRVVSVVPGFMRTGSHLNAFFAGDQEQEFEWFALGASLPLLSIDAQRAARAIVKATRRGTAQPILGVPAHLAARFHGLFPGTTNRLLALVNSLLPEASKSMFQRGAQLQDEIDSTLFHELTKSGSTAAERYQHFTPVKSS